MIGKKKRLSMNSITGLITALANKSNKTHTHSEYALSSHTHSEYAPSSHTHSEYAPSSHTHSEYAPSSHTHSWEDIENKPTDLATTQNITDAIDNIQIGGRNLLKNSIVNETSTAYGFAGRVVDLKAGETYTFSVNGRCNNVSEGKQLMACLYLEDWSWSVDVGTTSTEDKTSYVTFVAPKSDVYWIRTYYYPNSEPRLGNVTTNWYKVEKGNKPTDWTPAPEDFYNEINTKVDEIKDSCCKKITERLDFLEKLLKEKKILLKPRVETKNIGEFHGGDISLSGAIYNPTENPTLQKINISDTKEYSSIELTGVYPSYYSFYLTDGAYTEQPRFSSFLILVQTQNGQFFHQENVVPADVINQPFEIAISFPKSRVEKIFFVGIQPRFSVGTNYADGIHFENHENIITNYELFE